MANSKSGFNSVGQAKGPRRMPASGSRVLDGRASSPRKANGTGNRVPPAAPHGAGNKARPGGAGNGVKARQGTANISKPGR